MFEKWKSNGGIIGSKAKYSVIESFLSDTFCIISFCSALICRWTVCPAEYASMYRLPCGFNVVYCMLTITILPSESGVTLHYSSILP
jgi:hypothetical protein